MEINIKTSVKITIVGLTKDAIKTTISCVSLEIKTDEFFSIKKEYLC